MEATITDSFAGLFMVGWAIWIVWWFGTLLRSR